MITKTCPTCTLEIEDTDNHPDLIHCVRALVEYIRGSEKTLEEQLGRIDYDIRTAQQTGEDANELAENLQGSIRDLERQIDRLSSSLDGDE